MNTQRWQFNQNKLIGFGALFSLSVILIAATTTLPVTAQIIRSERTRFGGVYQVPDRNTFYNNQFPSSQPSYINPGYYPNPSPFNNRNPWQRQPILVNPSNGGVYQAPGRNTVIYNNRFPGYSPGYVNPGYYPNPNYYPNSNPGPVLVNPTIRNSTLINPVIITPSQRWQREDNFVQPARY